METVSGKKRVLIAKPGLDGHDRGARIVSMGLRDAGYEVIYTGRRATPDQIVNSAIQEDVDLIGLSILSGAHMTLFAKILELLEQNGADDIPVFGGGIIPPEDAEKLKEMGVKEIFGPGSSMPSILEALERHLVKPEKD